MSQYWVIIRELRARLVICIVQKMSFHSQVLEFSGQRVSLSRKQEGEKLKKTKKKKKTPKTAF